MEAQISEKKKLHQGKNAKQWRQLMGLSIIEMADFLKISKDEVDILEDKEEIESSMLEKIAEFIKVSPEVIKNKEPQEQFGNITNTFTVSDTGQGTNLGNGRDGIRELHYYNCTFNPLDKVVELYQEKEALYERLLASEREKS